MKTYVAPFARGDRGSPSSGDEFRRWPATLRFNRSRGHFCRPSGAWLESFGSIPGLRRCAAGSELQSTAPLGLGLTEALNRRIVMRVTGRTAVRGFVLITTSVGFPLMINSAIKLKYASYVRGRW